MERNKQYFKEYIMDLRSIIEISSFSLMILNLILLPISKVHRLDIALSISLIFYYLIIRPRIKDTQTFYVFRIIASNATRRAFLHFLIVRVIIKRDLEMYTNHYFIKYTIIMMIIFIMYLIILSYISSKKFAKKEKFFKNFKYNDKLFIENYTLENFENFKYYTNLSALYSDDNTDSELLDARYEYLKASLAHEEEDKELEKIRQEILKKIDEAYKFVKFEKK